MSLILEEVADCPQPVASFKHRAAALYAGKFSIVLKILATKPGISVIVSAATTINFVQFCYGTSNQYQTHRASKDFRK